MSNSGNCGYLLHNENSALSIPFTPGPFAMASGSSKPHKPRKKAKSHQILSLKLTLHRPAASTPTEESTSVGDVTSQSYEAGYNIASARYEAERLEIEDQSRGVNAIDPAVFSPHVMLGTCRKS